MLYCISIIINIYVLSIKGYPHVISHRGASGYVPEHSTAAYQLAIDLVVSLEELKQLYIINSDMVEENKAIKKLFSNKKTTL